MAAIDTNFERIFSELRTLRAEMREEFAAVRSEMRSDSAALRSDFAALRFELAAMSANTHSELVAARNAVSTYQQQTMWIIGGLAISLVGVLGSAVVF